MPGVPLHTGLEHPNLLWIVVPSALSFGAGILAWHLTDAGSGDTDAESVAGTGVDDQ